MFTDIKITVPKDCGNAPKKRILKDFNISREFHNYNFYDETKEYILRR